MPPLKEILRRQEELVRHHQRLAKGASDAIRREYLTALHQKTGRNILSYYSGFLSKPGLQGTEINDEDLNGFMNAVHGLDCALGVDLLLHTPGGSVAAVVSIVHYLRQKFGRNLRAVVPQIAMSGGTVIACACREIVLGKHSQLGPVDPQFGEIAAAGVLLEFERACLECREDPSRIPVWQAIIGQYGPTFLSQCENAIEWTDAIVREQLTDVMFFEKTGGTVEATRIAAELSDYRKNKRHERPLHFEDCVRLGLNVIPLEGDQEMQDMVLSAHHCYMQAMMNTGAFKIIENHKGGTIVKRLAAAPR